MHINRKMVSLFFEIKRSLPETIRVNLKISSPDVGQHMVKIHSLSNDNRVKNLIERFLVLADHRWLNFIEPLSESVSADFEIKKKVGEQIIQHKSNGEPCEHLYTHPAPPKIN